MTWLGYATAVTLTARYLYLRYMSGAHSPMALRTLILALRPRVLHPYGGLCCSSGSQKRKNQKQLLAAAESLIEP